ncbi:MAG: hypothetical protein ACP5D2_04195, partial [Candidatus Nanoarchaeia archaeon]
MMKRNINKPKKEKEKLTYIFPKAVAKKMKKIDQRTQMEASMMSMTLLLIGLIIVAAQQVMYGDFSWAVKGVIVFNILCGIVLIGSQVVTQYQQYVHHMMVMGIDPREEKKRLKAERKKRLAMKKVSKLKERLEAAGYQLTPTNNQTQHPGVKENISPPLGEGKLVGESNDNPSHPVTGETGEYPSA